MKLLRTSLLTPVVYLLATSPSAFGASTKSPKGYSGVHANVQNAVASGTKGAHANVAAATSGNLPFTGFDVTLMIVGVLVLVAVGAALRRFAGNHA
jgi:hypothetical protein